MQMIVRRLLRSDALAKRIWPSVVVFGEVYATQQRYLATEPPKADVKEQVRQQTENARTVSNWLMFPWERRQMDGENVPLRTWEKVYWWLFVGGLAALLFSWAQTSASAKDKAEELDEELEARKREMARAILAGKSLATAASDPFDGFTPRQIETYVQQVTGATSDDPYEGLTPEEIDAYVSKHGSSGEGTS